MSHIPAFIAGYWTCWLIERAIYAVLRYRRRAGITKASRKPSDVQYTHRQYRDAEGRREEGIRYEFMGVNYEE